MTQKRINILLADDDVDDCYFFKRALEELLLPAELLIVNDGEELMKYLSCIKKPLPDIIFLDINMPRKDGTECLFEMKLDAELINIPIVILSTAGERKLIAQVLEIGADVYIHKPNDFSQLKQVIYHALPLSVENSYSKKSLKYILNA